MSLIFKAVGCSWLKVYTFTEMISSNLQENPLADYQSPFLEEDIETQASALFPASYRPHFISHLHFGGPRRKKIPSKIGTVNPTVPAHKLQNEQNSRWCLFICGSNPIRTNYHFFGLMCPLGILKQSIKTTQEFVLFQLFHQQLLWSDLEIGCKKKKKKTGSRPKLGNSGHFSSFLSKI